jgi:hypothetical protein
MTSLEGHESGRLQRGNDEHQKQQQNCQQRQQRIAVLLL